MIDPPQTDLPAPPLLPTTSSSPSSSPTPNPTQIFSPEVEHINTLQFEISDLLGRLSRRNYVIETIRKAYLRDVITIKHEMLLRSNATTSATHDDNNIKNNIPSLDLRPTLQLFAPTECSLRVHPCPSCGGHLEIIHKESSKNEILTKRCRELMIIEQDVRLISSRMEIQSFRDKRALEEEVDRNVNERNVFINVVKELKGKLKEVDFHAFEILTSKVVYLERESSSNESKLSSYDNMKSEVTNLTSKVSTMKEKDVESGVKLREVTNQKNRIFNEKSLIVEENKDLGEKLILQIGSNATLQADIALQNIEATTLNATISRLQNLLDVSRTSEASLQIKLSTNESETRDAVELEQSNVEESERKNDDVRDQLRAKKKECEKYKGMVDDIESKLKGEYESKIVELQNQLGGSTTSTATTQVDGETGKAQRVDNLTEALMKKMEAKKNALNSTTPMVELSVVNTLEDEINHLKTDLEEMAIENDMLKAQMKAKKILGDGGDDDDEMYAMHAQLSELMSKVTQHKIAETDAKAEAEKHKVEVVGHKKIAEEALRRVSTHKDLMIEKDKEVELFKKHSKHVKEVMETQFKSAMETMNVQQDQIDKLNTSNPIEAKKLQDEMDNKMSKLMAQRDEGHRLNHSKLEDDLEETRLELEEAKKVTKKNTPNRSRIRASLEDFTSLGLEIEKIPKLLKTIADLNEDVELLKEAMADIMLKGKFDIQTEIDRNVLKNTAKSLKIAMMMQQVKNLKLENHNLIHGHVKIREIEDKLRDHEETFNLLNEIIVLKNKVAFLEDEGLGVKGRVKIKEERERQGEIDAQHNRILVKNYDQCRTHMVNLCRTLTANIVQNEKTMLTSDNDRVGIEFARRLPQVTETEYTSLNAVAQALDNGTEITYNELDKCMKLEVETELIVDFLSERFNVGSRLCDQREREGSASASASGSGSGGKAKVDVFAKQKESRLIKRTEEAERLLTTLKEDTLKASLEAAQKIEEAISRAEQAEEELTLEKAGTQASLTKLKAYDVLKSEHALLEVTRFKTENDLVGVSRELEIKVKEIKSVSADEFKMSVKNKNMRNVIDDHVNEIVRLKIEMKRVSRTLEDSKQVYVDLLHSNEVRLDSNVDVGTQSTSDSGSMACQTDFVEAEMTLRQTPSSSSSTLWAHPVVTPAYMDKVNMAKKLSVKMQMDMNRSVDFRQRQMMMSDRYAVDSGDNFPSIRNNTKVFSASIKSAPSSSSSSTGGGGGGSGSSTLVGMNNIDKMRRQLKSAGNAPRSRR